DAGGNPRPGQSHPREPQTLFDDPHEGVLTVLSQRRKMLTQSNCSSLRRSRVASRGERTFKEFGRAARGLCCPGDEVNRIERDNFGNCCSQAGTVASACSCAW